jgi:hypothetical protein
MMQIAARILNGSNGESVSDWGLTLDRLIHEVEAAEFALAYEGAFEAREQRKNSGSFYTPIDVADHFWELFFRVHCLSHADEVRRFITQWQFVEPSAGSGIFVFTFLRRALAMGVSPSELSRLRFHVIDINLAALRFFSEKLHELEKALGVKFENVGPDQIDFLEWTRRVSLNCVAFVGNPPYVSNLTGSRWRNLYADFLEAMLHYPSEQKAIGLILPLSICFSRDYAALRSLISRSGLGVSTSNYDNIPDCLFKSGKPESTNTNRANSQRCTILNLGGSDPKRREATALSRWSASERSAVLTRIPSFQNYDGWEFDGQFPRPENAEILEYLARTRQAMNIKSLTSGTSSPAFGVGAVARNYIGLREADDPNSVKIRPSSETNMLVLLQVFSSQIFFDYWRTVGDGFHVTLDIIERFPIADELYQFCHQNRHQARVAWAQRSHFAKEKLNSGKIVRSYDFSRTFADWSVAFTSGGQQVREIA